MCSGVGEETKIITREESQASSPSQEEWVSLKVDMKVDEPRQPPLTTLTKPNGTAGSTRPRHLLTGCCPAQPDRLAASAGAAQHDDLPFPPSCMALTLKQMTGKSIGWYVKNPQQNYLCGGSRPQITGSHRDRKEEKRLLHLNEHTQQIGQAGQVESNHSANQQTES